MRNSARIKIRSVEETDWPAIVEIERHAYATIAPEAEDVLRSKNTLSPGTCLVATDLRGTIHAYCLAHPFARDTIPALNVISTANRERHNLFIHDLAVSLTMQGHGIGRLVFLHLREIAMAKSFTSMSLVAVQSAESFWRKMGFQRTDKAHELANYDHSAQFMVSSI